MRRRRRTQDERPQRHMVNVLVVEDEAPLRHIIARNLERHGYHVWQAESVVEAEHILCAGGATCDLILLDVNLPDAAGWDVLRHLEHEEQRPPRVIVVSAVRPAQSRVAAFQPAAVLLKPFPIETLLRLVERVLGRAPAEPAP